MARSVGVAIENNFVNGLVTEATGLNFPENAVVETDNCVFNEKGIVSRRLGIDFETDYQLQTINKTGNVITEYKWSSVANNGENNFAVLQIGNILYFYRTSISGSLSGDPFASTVNINDFLAPGAPPPNQEEAQFTSGSGYLFVSHPFCDPFYVEFDEDTETFTGKRITINIRDVEGVPDGYGQTEMRSTITNEHWYNLKNQGWEANKINIFRGQIGAYPSNAQVWWVYKDANEAYAPGSTYSSIESGNRRAARGYFIGNAFNFNRSAISGHPGLPTMSSGYQRPRCIEFFSGRVFYAGVDADGYGGKIYFSQIVQGPEDFGRCHQENDPTSEFLFDLLPSDGGVISIPELGAVIKLFSIESSLLVFASNGIWAIGGSTGVGFSANDYTVRRISAIPALTGSSFIDAGGLPVWWNTDSIYGIRTNPTFGSVEVQSLLDQRIKTYFEQIPPESKRYAKGAFNLRDRTIQWLFRKNPASTIDERYTYDTILTFNIMTQAFYPWSLNYENGIGINGILVVEGQGSQIIEDEVETLSGQLVTDNALDNVTVTQLNTLELPSVYKYVTTIPDEGGTHSLTFSEAFDSSYKDFSTPLTDGIDYESYFISGYRVHGDGQRDFQSNYINIYTLNDSLSTFYLQGIWDFATSPNTGRWSSRQKIQITDPRYSYRGVRRKIRGHGKALQFKITSHPGEPFDIIGWSVFETGNTTP